MKEKKTAKSGGKQAAFARDQILDSAAYAGRRDLLSALLKADECYTLEQVEALIQEFMERKVS